jgi:predicted CoA-binding protein
VQPLEDELDQGSGNTVYDNLDELPQNLDLVRIYREHSRNLGQADINRARSTGRL